MNPSSSSIESLLLSGLMGIFGGLLTIPVNAVFTFFLKRDELLFQHKLDLILKQRELLLEHKLEIERHSTQRQQGDNENLQPR